MSKRQIEGFFLLSGGYTRKGVCGRINDRSRVAELLRLCAEARKLSPKWRKHDHASYMSRIRAIRLIGKPKITA